jgi:DNA helicase-2/ATP-dependent DNA helicase PcrA
MEEGLFPSRPDEKDDELEEERRIFYVSITRARKELYLTSCRRRFMWGRTTVQMPSRFLGELPREYVEVEGRPAYGADPFDSGYEGEEYERSYSRARDAEGAETEAVSEEGYRRGIRVYHDDYGPGVVQKVETGGSQELVWVRFESGQTARFFPRYSSLEIIGEDMV